MNAVETIPRRRLAGLYFGYFAFIGAFAPYFPLYLQSLGQAAWQIGVLLSLMQLARVLGPYFWAWLADRHGWRARLLRWTVGAAIAAYCGLFGVASFAALLPVLAAFAFFSSATMPVLESLTLAALRGRIDGYGAIRSWGSVGFVAAVMGAGWLLDRLPIASLLWLLLAPLAATLALAFGLRDRRVPDGAPHGPIWPLLRRPEVLAVLGANVLMNLAHGPLYAFYSIYLAAVGYDKTAIGALWSLGVLAEIGVFLVAGRLLARVAAADVLAWSLALAVVRFVLIGWGVESPALLVVAQLMHAATFGTCHLASLALISRWFTGARQVRGQALYTTLSFGVGGFVGAVGSGLAWESIGPAWTFSAAATAAALGVALLYWQAPRIRAASRSTAAPGNAL